MTDGAFPFPTPTCSHLELEPQQALNLLVPVINPQIFATAEEEPLSCCFPSTRGQGEGERRVAGMRCSLTRAAGTVELLPSPWSTPPEHPLVRAMHTSPHLRSGGPPVPSRGSRREIARSSAPSQNEHFSLQFRPRFVPHIKEEPCTRCLHHSNSSGTLVGLRKVPAARSDNAVGSAEREEREVTARESRSPITRKLSVPELGRRRSAQAPESYFGAFLPEKSRTGAGGRFPRAGDAVGPSLGTVVPGTAMLLQSSRGVVVPGRWQGWGQHSKGRVNPSGCLSGGHLCPLAAPP